MNSFDLDPHFEQAFARSDFARDLLAGEAREVAALAADLAPDDPATTGRDLRSSVHAVMVMTPAGWVGRVIADDFKAGWFEQGASGVPARPFLRPALERIVGPVEATAGGQGGAEDA